MLRSVPACNNEERWHFQLCNCGVYLCSNKLLEMPVPRTGLHEYVTAQKFPWIHSLDANERRAGQVGKSGTRVREKKVTLQLENGELFLMIAWPVELQIPRPRLRPSLQVRAPGTGGNVGLSLPHAKDKYMSSITRAVNLLHLINTKFTLKREKKKLHVIYYTEGVRNASSMNLSPKRRR